MTPIEFHDVYRSFGTQDVLRGLSLSVRPGEIYALLGRNGSGKTTALRVLLGFLRPMAGHARVLGIDSQALSPTDRGRIGYVSEGHRLYGSFRVRDAIQFEAGTWPSFRKDYAVEATRRCGLPPKKLVMQLSRGQRAQLALIFAVAGQPEVMIFDDPAMGLDVVMRREFLDVMIDLLSDQGIGVLFFSHILTDVERIADRVGILHGGRLMVDAPMAELKQRVQKRFWSGPNGAAASPPKVEGMLRSQPRKDGWELTLLDLDEKSLVVRGEKGTYGWTGDEFVEVDAGKISFYWTLPKVKVTVDDQDPFTFTAAVRGADDQTLFTHRYALYTWHEKLPATVAFGTSLLRLPLLQVQGFARSEGRSSFRDSEFTDPLLAGHKRCWLLGLNLLVAGTLVVLAVRRLRRLEAPRGRTLCWAIAIAALGLPLFLYYRCTETDRAWRRVPILGTDEIPDMWIRSA